MTFRSYSSCALLSLAMATALFGQTLPQMVDITWSLGPNLPQGFQDSDGGIIDNTLVTAGGFQNISPRGFVNETWGLDLSDPQADWVSLPDFPGSNNPANVDGAGRQELASVVVNNEIYAWGGFNYTAPFAYADGYRLSHAGGTWAWDTLPPLPNPVSSPAITAVGSYIYAVGGADYDSTAFYTDTDRNGNNPGLGRKFFRLDTNDLGAGWTNMPDLPGTPRWVHAAATVGDQVYVFGGATGGPPYRSTVDNWRFDTSSGQWHQLADLPVSSGNFPSGPIVLDDRFIMLVGGFQYEEVRNPDGTVRPAYGEATKTIPGNVYFSDIWVYDTLTDQFGTATPLPNNNNLPMTVVDGNKLYLLGGETGGFTFDGQTFGHHPDSTMIGDMSVVFDSSLTLFVNQATGATRIENVSATDRTLDGYEIRSPQGALDPSDPAWHSLADAGVPGWSEIGTPTSNLLGELNPQSQSMVAPGGSLSLGTPYTPTEFGSGGDLTFAFSTDSGDVITAAVVYEGINNLVLAVNPATGEAGLHNPTIFDVAIDGYEISSVDGSLLPGDGDWVSLSDNPNVTGWLEIGTSTSNLLAELMPTGSLQLASGEFIALGTPFAIGAAQDLSFSFSMFGGGVLDGVVQYGALPGDPVCDLDGNGSCNTDDLRVLYDDIAAGTLGGGADIDGSGIVDNDDIDDWLASAGTENGKVYVTGDTDLDGSVGGNDFTQLAVDFGNTGLPDAYWDNGNFDGDMGGFTVGGPDFTQLAVNFGHVSATAVPEPGALSILLAVTLGLMVWLTRRPGRNLQVRS